MCRLVSRWDFICFDNCFNIDDLLESIFKQDFASAVGPTRLRPRW